MDEINDVRKKYDESYISANLFSVTEINKFAATFYKDVAAIYDAITRIRNVERNPTGFSLNDAPILGLLTRVWKILKEVIRYYEENNAEIIGFLERPLMEASITATYLLESDDAVIEDYRKCSYKSRLRILRDLEQGSPFLRTKSGKRLVKSIREKMEFEGLSESDFDVQRRNHWKIQGKPFFKIFSEIVGDHLYASSYGMMSENIHGSWNESMDYGLHKNEDGTFSTYPFYREADVRFVTPIIRFCNMPFRPWLKRIDADHENLIDVLNWIDKVNAALFKQFDEKFEG